MAEVVSGHSFVEQAAITGESMPSEKTAGSAVYAGTINQTGTLQVRAERLGKETTFGKIIEAVEKAEHSRAPIQKTADRLAGYLVYFALGAAVLTFLITHNIRSTISVVIVAGACGIAAGTPLAILGAIGRAARQGSIIKGGIYLEALGTVGYRLSRQDRHADLRASVWLRDLSGGRYLKGSVDRSCRECQNGTQNTLWDDAIVRFAEQREASGERTRFFRVPHWPGRSGDDGRRICHSR